MNSKICEVAYYNSCDIGTFPHYFFKSFVATFFPRVRNVQILIIKINTKVLEVCFYCGRQYNVRSELQIFQLKMCKVETDTQEKSGISICPGASESTRGKVILSSVLDRLSSAWKLPDNVGN